MYSEIRSEYQPIIGVWQTHDLYETSYPNWNNTLDSDGNLRDGDGDLITNSNIIDIIGGDHYSSPIDMQEYRLTLENGKVVLIENLKDEAYWKEKEAKEEKEYWDSLSSWGKVKCAFYRAKHNVRWWYILKFRRKWLAELMVAPIRTPINYTEIGRKIITVDPMNDPAKEYLAEHEN